MEDGRPRKAMLKYLEKQDYEILDYFDAIDAPIDFVTRRPGGDGICFVSGRVHTGVNHFPTDSDVNRAAMEFEALQWLMAHQDDDSTRDQGISFDVLDMIVFGDDRAFLRHHINALSADGC